MAPQFSECGAVMHVRRFSQENPTIFFHTISATICRRRRAKLHDCGQCELSFQRTPQPPEPPP